MKRIELIGQILYDERDRTQGDESEQREAYLTDLDKVLETRLTEPEYLVCEDFDLDLPCCAICHQYAAYDMSDITLADGRHAWVCDPFRHVLMREIKAEPKPEHLKVVALLEQIFGGSSKPDLVEEALNDANRAAQSDSERLRLCLEYAHHRYGRKQTGETAEQLLHRARRLLGTAPASSAKIG